MYPIAVAVLDIFFSTATRLTISFSGVNNYGVFLLIYHAPQRERESVRGVSGERDDSSPHLYFSGEDKS